MLDIRTDPAKSLMIRRYFYQDIRPTLSEFSFLQMACYFLEKFCNLLNGFFPCEYLARRLFQIHGRGKSYNKKFLSSYLADHTRGFLGIAIIKTKLL